tara:strand:+ start:1534 stop:2061 length:528 start_codon:yes stop_codon:yes gene_type:complete
MFLNNNGRIHYDSVNITQNEIVNNRALNYTLNSVKQSNTNAKISLSEPDIHTFGAVSIDQKIDDNSNMLLNRVQNTINRDRSTIIEPIFASSHATYKGRGEGNAGLESILKKGEAYRDKKIATSVSEKSGQGVQDYPLLSNVKNTLAKPSNFVETKSSRDWIRGGIPTRELSKYA